MFRAWRQRKYSQTRLWLLCHAAFRDFLSSVCSSGITLNISELRGAGNEDLYVSDVYWHPVTKRFCLKCKILYNIVSCLSINCFIYPKVFCHWNPVLWFWSQARKIMWNMSTNFLLQMSECGCDDVTRAWQKLSLWILFMLHLNILLLW